jgi:hypothetical protein
VTLEMRLLVPLIASALLILFGLIILFLSTGEMRTFGWVLFAVGIVGTGVNFVMWSRSRRP